MSAVGRLFLSLGLVLAILPPALLAAWYAGQDIAPVMAAITPPAAWFEGLAWMAWTWQTAAFFGVIAWALLVMTLWEVLRPGGNPRSPGILRIDTTRGDRLFITLLSAAWIHLAWLALAGDAPLWGASIISAVLGLVIFILV